MHRTLTYCVLGLGLLLPQRAGAQAKLENPANGSFQSGLGDVHGWKCVKVGNLTYTIDNSAPLPLAYGLPRNDTVGPCGDSNNGFIVQQNWNLIGDGQHTIRVFDNGVQFAQAAFRVATLQTEFLEGASGRYRLNDFPEAGLSVVVRWDESLQNFVIEGECPPLQDCCSSHGGVCSCLGGAVICCDGSQSPTCGFD
jgi:hypothetical protein